MLTALSKSRWTHSGPVFLSPPFLSLLFSVLPPWSCIPLSISSFLHFILLIFAMSIFFSVTCFTVQQSSDFDYVVVASPIEHSSSLQFINFTLPQIKPRPYKHWYVLFFFLLTLLGSVTLCFFFWVLLFFTLFVIVHLRMQYATIFFNCLWIFFAGSSF